MCQLNRQKYYRNYERLLTYSKSTARTWYKVSSSTLHDRSRPSMQIKFPFLWITSELQSMIFNEQTLQIFTVNLIFKVASQGRTNIFPTIFDYSHLKIVFSTHYWQSTDSLMEWYWQISNFDQRITDETKSVHSWCFLTIWIWCNIILLLASYQF